MLNLAECLWNRLKKSCSDGIFVITKIISCLCTLMYIIISNSMSNFIGTYDATLIYWAGLILDVFGAYLRLKSYRNSKIKNKMRNWNFWKRVGCFKVLFGNSSDDDVELIENVTPTDDKHINSN